MTHRTGRPGDSTCRLRDGRRLQWLEIGKSDGAPIFHFHGNGSSRLDVLTVREVAEHIGIRLICPATAAHLLAQALPHCTATFYPNEGHLSTFVNHAQDIWKALSAAREESTNP